jgi:UDP-N-acetylglucosamine:LPS N-acetylglucosamine transferase
MSDVAGRELNQAEKPWTILVLTNDSGMGHRHAAEATVAALEARYGGRCRPLLVNPLNEPEAPASLRDLQSDFNRVIRHAPALYSAGHAIANTYLPTWLMERMETRLLGEPIGRVLANTRPDIVVTTHPAFVYLLVDYRKRHGESWPLVVLVTDLARLQRLWFRPEVDLYLVPTEEAAELAARRGIAPERVHVTGVPVDLRLADVVRSKRELRDAYGWDPALAAVLAVGSRRVHEFRSFLDAIDAARLPIQLIVVTGDDAEMYAELNAVEWLTPTHVYGHVDDFPERLRAADAIVTKAGGLTVAESLAAGLPLFIIQSTPMHEKGNAAYVVTGGAAVRAEEPDKLTEALRGSLANDCRLLAAMAENARRLGRPRAAYNVAERLWALSVTGRQSLVLDQ